MTDPRQDARQSDDPRSGTHYHPEFLQFVPATPDRRLPRWFWIMLAVAALLIAGMSIARAAEVPGKWEITLYHKGANYDAVERTHRVLATYDSRAECQVMITRVKVHVSGARLVCAPAETRRVK